MYPKRRISPYVTPVLKSSSSRKDFILSEYRDSSPVDQFLFQDIEVNGVVSRRYTSDIYMLFNQQRLDRMTRDSLLSYFESLQVREPQFADLRAKLGDEQLISFVKSRYIQSASELMSWHQYLMSSSDEAVAALAAAQSDQSQQFSAEQSTSAE